MPAALLSCDWGTTHFRLRAVSPDGANTLGEFRSTEGVATLAEAHAPADRAAAFRFVLAEAIATLGRTNVPLDGGMPVLISGMAGSSLGWQELPYAELPFPLDGSGVRWQQRPPVEVEGRVHDVFLLSGVRSREDVCRGEETELLGLFTEEAMRGLAERCLVIQPGTHSKHLRIERRLLVDFRTFMTGELFDVLSRHSVLRHSVATGGREPEELAESDFRAGVRAAAELPLAAVLFRVRTRQVLEGIGGVRGRAFLSGALIGSELAHLTVGEAADVPLVLCASHALHAPYRIALEELSPLGRTTLVDADAVDQLVPRGQALWWRNRESAGRP